MEQIREIIGDIKTRFRLDIAFCDKFEELEKRMYALEEDNKRMVATVRSLEKRYSELLYMFRSYQKDHA